MVINRNSWHYKFISAFDFECGVRDLCSYVRAFAKAVIVTSLIAFVVVMFLAGLTMPLWGWGIFLDGGVIGFIFCYFIFSMIASSFAKEISEYKNHEGILFRKIQIDLDYSLPARKEKPPKPETRLARVLREYYKAFKNKTCPLVTFQ